MKNENEHKYLKYSGLAFQMFALLLILTFLGKKADAYFQFEIGYLTALFLIVGLTAFMYKLIKELE